MPRQGGPGIAQIVGLGGAGGKGGGGFERRLGDGRSRRLLGLLRRLVVVTRLGFEESGLEGRRWAKGRDGWIGFGGATGMGG